MSILRADSIRDRAGTGAPDFPNGATVTGVVTATSFSGNITGNLTGNADTATSATSATNAQGLTGTPNITVGTVTGTDATFSGNLTVNGTTTTIDTAVTAVDSLAVDGNVGVGTTNPVTKLVVASSDSGHADMRFQNSTTGYLTNNGFWVGINNNENALIYNYQNSDLLFATNSAVRLVINSAGTAIFKAGLAEKINVKTQLTGANSTSINDGNVILTTTAEPGNTYPNITGVHTVLSSGEGFSITIALKVNGSGTINNFYIDGVPQNIEWSGGSAPSAGSSGYDVFTFTAIKTGTGTSDYKVFGAAVNYD